MADLREDLVRTILRPSDSVESHELNQRFGEMESEAVETMNREGVASDDVIYVRVADIRYMGQGFELEVPVASGTLNDNSLNKIYEEFHKIHTQIYGYSQPESEMEIVNLRLTALARMPRPDLDKGEYDLNVSSDVAKVGIRKVFFRDQSIKTNVYDRSKLVPGNMIKGPAIIEQLDSTTVLWPDQTASVDRYLNLLLERIK